MKLSTMQASRYSAGALDISQSNKVLRNSYMLLAITLLPTIAGAALGAFFPLMLIAGPGISLVIFLVALFGIQALVIRNRHSTRGIAWLLVFTGIMGYFMGPLVGYALGSLSNGLELVSLAVLGTAGIFFTMSAYATTTKRDLSSVGIGRALVIGLLVVFVMSIVNAFFLEMPLIALGISAVVILICTGLIAHTINSVVRGGESNYIMVTMTLYIMLLNIFQSLLHILMAFAGNRE